jgi:hypothetical protein
METLCHRCHQAVSDEDCYCPNCGMPQLVYAAEAGSAQAEQGLPDEIVQDAGTVDWKAALRAAIMMAIPAGVLSSAVSPLGNFGLVWMSVAAAWAVALYTRSRRPAWLTMGAGARIGLVTGLLAAWLSFAISGGALFVERFLLHQSGQIDAAYSSLFFDKYQQLVQQSIAEMAPADAEQARLTLTPMLAWLQAPDGHACVWAFAFASQSFFLLLIAVGGGALGARWLARPRRPRI